MRVTCPSCGLAIRVDDIDLSARKAPCRRCGAIARIAIPNADRLRPKLGRPLDLRWTEHPTSTGIEVAIAQAWWPMRWQGAPLGFLALLWNGIVVLGVCAGLTTSLSPSLDRALLLVTVFIAALFLAVGGYVAYMALVLLFNRTQVTVNRDRLHVVRAPIREPGDVQEVTSEIECFAVGEEPGPTRSTKPGERSGAHASIGTVFSVQVQDRRGTSRKTHLAFRDRAHAEYAADRLAQLVEDVRASATPYRGA
jgi:hypothetical protein